MMIQSPCSERVRGPQRTTPAPRPSSPAEPGEVFTASATPPLLGPDHSWLAQDFHHTPVPAVPLEAWKNARRYDVVVAGGGMGGLFTAWRLEGCDGSPSLGKKVALFERTQHLGGRVHTAPLDGNDRPMDVGAMRFLPNQHPLLNSLCEHFKIPTQQFAVSGENNLNYFRGKRLTNKQIEQNPAALPYNVTPEERGKSVDDLLKKAIGAIIPGFDTMTTAELEKAMRETVVDGVNLQQLGLMNILKRTLSQEAMQMVTDAVGYESDLQNWDAGQAIQELGADYHPGAIYKSPLAGMGAFPRAMVADLQKKGTELQRHQSLRQVSYDANSKHFRLIFEDDQGKANPVVASQLVLNLPKKPLDTLVQDSPYLHGTPLEQISKKASAHPLTRIFVAYDRPWWNDLGIEGGRSTTDLNLGMVYYHGGKEDKRPYLEVYNDGAKSEFWEGLQNPGDPGVTTQLSVKPQLANELQKELEELHGRSLPKPTGYLYKRWADPFLGAGWHTWNAGSRPLDATQTMAQPVAGVPLYVCGEAFSTAQGWIEGALKSSENVLQRMGKQPFRPAQG